MTDKEVISAVKYVSRMKPEFMLSEIRDYIKRDKTTKEIYNSIHPLLYDLGLKSEPAGEDYKIIRLPPVKPFVLSDGERKRNDEYFQSPRVPRKLERLIEQYIEKKVGKAWDDKVILERIRKAIEYQKAEYWKEGKTRKISYEKGYSILGYLAYQFPVYFVQFEHILYDMTQDGLLKTRMKVLDAGTGPGTVPLALIDFYNRLDDNEAKVYSIEKYDENIEAYMALVPGYAGVKSKVGIERPIKADLTNLDLEKIPEGIDLLIFSNVLNELKDSDIEQRADIVMSLAKKLSPDGNIVIIEPADKVNSTEMRALTRSLIGRGLGVYSPCSFIWCERCRLSSCWSFEEKEDIQPPRLMTRVAACEEPFRYMNTDIKYSYAILRKDTLTMIKYRVPPRAKFARLSKLKDHVGKRINVVASVMSGDLGDKKNKVYKLCDGTSIKPVYAIIPSHSIIPGNEALVNAGYGNVIEIYNVLVRYNEENDAYNLQVGRSTTVKVVE